LPRSCADRAGPHIHVLREAVRGVPSSENG
jgi:hypothetical protein